ncbi:MAG: UDPGP type 1 family protein [Lachnospiraceae bacterium]|nr:UDPGP type 1 family protein [Lachnospiraceae bacterium]
MNYEQIKEKLNQYGQSQLLRFYEELDDAQKATLLDEISRIDFDLIRTDKTQEQPGEISPIEALTLNQIREKEADFRQEGLAAIRNCNVAAVLLAGGQGTRLGLDGPKGTLNVGINRELYIFQCLINNLMDVKKEADAWIPLLIMTSEKNDADTRAFFEAHEYFGYNKDYVFFFVQEMAPSTDFDGKVYLEEKGHISLSPNGNGGWFISLQKAGLLEKIKALGVQWLNVFAVDNVLQRMADPVFVGATIQSGQPIGAKVIRKAAPDEKVGVMCYRDNHPSIVEYYELTDEMMTQKNDKGELAYNFGVILNYLFKLSELERIAGENMPLHIVDKKIPYVDENGNKIKPEEPNGHKFETLVLDMIQMMDGCLVFEVERAKEFAPIKNMHGTDSLDSAREMMQKIGIEL